MNPLVQRLSRELAAMPAGDRERLFAERQIAPEIRAEVESLINSDSTNTLRVGKKLGTYEITALLGKGGMGEVYRARDWKLKRDVAIKVLPEEFSCDAARLARFQREAEALASLNHPNIAGIFDLQESGTTPFLVLELVEGETLADILKHRGALPIDEALRIAKQICEALEAAHEKAIVHRDLKPANVKIGPDEKVKVLDFGLAKVLESAPDNAASSKSSTLMMVSRAGIDPAITSAGAEERSTAAIERHPRRVD